ncbi:MAG: DUF1735 domain-containing protein [Bacteroidetes bacterium]|nr:DUF1735 domain-containing protein [Bacteroidota bacterium]
MNKLFRTIPFLFIPVLFLACKKSSTDTGVENAGIGFSIRNDAKAEFTLQNIPGKQLIGDFLFITNRSENAAQNNIHIQLEDKTTALVNQYNSVNGTSVVPLPSGSWSFSQLVTLGGGNSRTPVFIEVSGANSLPSNTKYGIGLKIRSADGNARIAANAESILIILDLTNSVYDGRYAMRGQYYHPSIEPTFAQHITNVELRDVSYTSGHLRLFWPFSGGYNMPFFQNGGNPYCCLSDNILEVRVDPSTNLVTPVCLNPDPGTDCFFQYVTRYNGNNYQNRYDPTTKTFYLAFGHNVVGGTVVIPGSNRVWIDTLTYLGPR